MIFYFSGTGNTRYAATAVAKACEERLLYIPDEIDHFGKQPYTYTLTDDERIGFAFPVYGWGLPLIVREFIERLSFNNYKGQYLFFLCTCGDDIGTTCDFFRRTIRPKGWTLHSAWSILMPDCYISLPGFDVDSDEERNAKLSAAPELLKQIGLEVKERQRNVFRLKPGAFAWVKSHVLGAFFNKFLMGDRPFLSTDDCIRCGICAKVCPLHNIDCTNGRPVWLGHCTGCLSCYHHCPKKAVQYGGRTKGKGQYLLKTYIRTTKEEQ